MICPSCARESPVGAHFCVACGAALGARVVVSCARCAAELPDGARFCPRCGHAAAGTTAPATVFEAERRHLTVMFCDLVGSTPLAERLDAEDVHAVIRAYQSTCDEVIRRFEGHIAQYLGDGLLVFFGYPLAHEDDAQRAVRAGLGILDALAQLNTRLEAERGIRLAARIGIHSGQTVVGDTGGIEDSGKQVFGHTMNFAARLQGLAEVDSVVISEATLRLVQGLFVVRSRGQHELKGIAGPVSVYRVLQAAGVGAAVDRGARARLTPLVGRAREMSLLLDLWSRCREGSGQVILVSGEAGIGKSRLVQELRGRLAEERHTWLPLRCSPYHAHTALFPVTELMRVGLFFHEEDSTDEKRGKLARALEEVGLASGENLALFADLLDLPLPEAQEPLTLSAGARRQRTLEALARWLFGFAQQQPLVVVVEDLHWLDPTTLDLLIRLVERVAAERVLVLLTARPDFAPPWPGGDHLSALSLSPLSPLEIGAMVTGVAGRTLPEELVQQLSSRTDGVPLFVEELTKMVVESDLVVEKPDGYELSAPLPALAIPTTLQDSLMARLDRLAPIKGVAQIAAVLGREFSYEQLSAVAQLEDQALRVALEQLVEAQLLQQSGVIPKARYSFRHALLQESAYGSLLRSSRQQLHRRVASALRERFPAIAEEQPELLAHHCEAAGAIDDAIQFLESAGRRATAASAYAESSRHLTRALGLLVTRPQTPARDVLELELQMGLGIALIATRGYASSELESVFMRAKELCERIAPGPRLFPVLRGRAAFHMARAEYAIARPLAEQCLEQAQQVGDSGFFLAGGSPLITTLFVLGDFAGVLALHERMSEIHDPAQHGALTFVFGEDPMLVARAFAALALQITGHSGRALELAEEGLRIARQRGHPIDIATALVYLAWLHQVRGEGPAAREYAREACDLARDQSLFFWGAFGLQVLGWSEGCCGEPEAGVALLRQGQALWSSGGIGTGRLAFLLWIAETELRAGRVEAARSAAEESLAHHRAHGEVHVLADLLRLHGDIALAGDVPDPAAAQAHYERALEIARSQGARAFELRAATRLARLLAEQGRASAARALLQPIHAALVGSFQSADMEPARELLAQLA